jgi:ABC-type transport system involved in multi-copper enzyme maturation permease subunit
MVGSFRAEMLKLTKRPALWLLLGIALALGLLFAYVFPYLGATTDSTAPNADRGLASILPAGLVGNTLGGYPVFLGALLVVLGVLFVGGEYGWGTWKTVLTQGPSRGSVLAGKFGALTVAALGFVVAIFVMGAVASVVVAAAQDASMAFPSAFDLLRGVGAAWLIATMWAMFGAVLGILLRGVALAVGLGLVWMLVVQSLISELAAPLLSWVDTGQQGLPGPGAGSLVAALGAPSGTPGVQAVMGGGPATLVVAAYLVGFVALGTVVLRRRDIL